MSTNERQISLTGYHRTILFRRSRWNFCSGSLELLFRLAGMDVFLILGLSGSKKHLGRISHAYGHQNFYFIAGFFLDMRGCPGFPAHSSGRKMTLCIVEGFR
jgi:hypothetical protein